MKHFLSYLQKFFVSDRRIASAMHTEQWQKADALLAELIDHKKVPGLAITVLKNGREIFRKGYGYADLDTKTPVQPENTLFRIASASKPIAALALARMVSEGQIALDASFYDYVPDYPRKEFNFTIRQLAGHTAGIRGYKGKEYALNKPYGIRDGTQLFRDDPLLFEPGKGFHYNSFGWVLVSLAMEEAGGMPFDSYVAKKVLWPVGLQYTFPETTRPGMGEPATFYTKSAKGFRRAVPVNNRYKLAGGGYIATAPDLAKLGQWTLEQYEKKELLYTDFLSSQLVNGKPTHYGLGWEVGYDKQERPYFGHTGNGVGGYSNFFVFPETRLVFAILINCTNPRVQDQLDAVAEVFLEPATKPGQAV